MKSFFLPIILGSVEHHGLVREIGHPFILFKDLFQIFKLDGWDNVDSLKKEMNIYAGWVFGLLRHRSQESGLSGCLQICLSGQSPYYGCVRSVFDWVTGGRTCPI